MQQSPFLTFSRDQWQQYRHDTPLTLTESDLAKLRGRNEPTSLREVEEVYLPLSRLLNLYVNASQQLYAVTSEFLGHPEPRVPYIIGVAGSVAVGKSTISRLLQTLLSRWPTHPNVALLTTDGFLYSTAELEARNLMYRKGFPESYDVQHLLDCLDQLKAGKKSVQVPIYSHQYYDILPGQFHTIESPDIVIVEGLNVLQVPLTHAGVPAPIVVSDYFDFSIYVDAEPDDIARWFLERFMILRAQSSDKKELFMHQFSVMPDEEAVGFAMEVWQTINAINLKENISPYKHRAHLILQKGADHVVEQILLRKI